MLLSAAAAQGQDLQNFVYQSSYNNEMYVIQQKDNFNLDLYSEDGKLIASLNRKKTSEKFKGTTYQLANKCPDGKGKVEVVDILADRVRMRVERPTEAKNVKPACMQILLPAWDTFELVRHHPLPSPEERAARRAPVQTRPMQGGGSGPERGGVDDTSMIQDAEGFTFELQRCEKKGGASVTCFLTATNHKLDRALQLSGGYHYGNAPKSAMVDSDGNSQFAVNATLGTAQGGVAQTDTVADVTVKGNVVFGGVDPGVNRIAKLTIGFATWTRGNEQKITLTFRNVPLENAVR